MANTCHLKTPTPSFSTRLSLCTCWRCNWFSSKPFYALCMSVSCITQNIIHDYFHMLSRILFKTILHNLRIYIHICICKFIPYHVNLYAFCLFKEIVKNRLMYQISNKCHSNCCSPFLLFNFAFRLRLREQIFFRHACCIIALQNKNKKSSPRSRKWFDLMASSTFNLFSSKCLSCHMY